MMMNDLTEVLEVRPADANYLVNFSTQFSYIYVETPKVACSTIKKLLQLAEVGGDASRLHEDVHERAASPLPTIRRQPEAFWQLYHDPEAFRFGFVRNPFSRALSCYLDKFVQDSEHRDSFPTQLGLPAGSRPSFRSFLRAVQEQSDAERNVHWAQQSFLLNPDRFRYSFLGRFEFLELELDRLTARLGIPRFAGTRVTPHATSAGERIRAYYGPAEIALVQSIYAADFESFGYGWSPDIL